jgi:murein DD-endopeptidase MepM/ murein hydrolase activator NlpD
MRETSTALQPVDRSLPASRATGKGRHRIRRGAVLIGLLAVLVGTGAPAALHTSADTYDDQINGKQGQLDQANNLISRLQKEIADLANQEAQLRTVIAALDQQIAQQKQKIADQQAKLDQVSAALAGAQAQLAGARARLSADKASLAQQLVNIYKLGDDTAINDILSAGNFNEFWQRLIDVNRVAGSEQSVVNSVQGEERGIEATVARIADDKAQQAQLLTQLHTESDQLQQQLAARQQAQRQLDFVVAQDQKRLALEEQSRKELAAQIDALKAEQAAARLRGGGNGHFLWPVSGPISQYFGCTSYPFEAYDPGCPYPHRFHSGLDIAAAWGTPIVAGDTGIAHPFFSSYGCGNHVIIVHGNGWTSLYCHMSSLGVADGQVVGRGQYIGNEGSTGNSSGPHLHFQIELNGVPRDPIQYLS